MIYTLTEKGLDLFPAIQELLRWGTKHNLASNTQVTSVPQPGKTR